MIMTLVIVGILFIVGLLIFAKVDSAAENILDPQIQFIDNETLGTITVEDEEEGGTLGDHNSTLISQTGYIVDSETVINDSGQGVTLVRGQDYSIVLLTGVSGEVGVARGNFTLLNISATVNGEDDDGFNNSALNILYQRNVLSAAQITTDTIEDTVLDSFELGVIALIVIAAVVILALVFRLGTS